MTEETKKGLKEIEATFKLAALMADEKDLDNLKQEMTELKEKYVEIFIDTIKIIDNRIKEENI